MMLPVAAINAVSNASMVNKQWSYLSRKEPIASAGICKKQPQKHRRRLRFRFSVSKLTDVVAVLVISILLPVLRIGTLPVATAQDIDNDDFDVSSQQRHRTNDVGSAGGSGTTTGNSTYPYDDSCSKRFQRQIDQLQKEVGYCNAIKMAVETRESVVKQQLTDIQQQLPTGNQLNEELSAQRKRIQELENLLTETTTSHQNSNAALRLSLNEALRRITEFEPRENEFLVHKERNEYLEMRLEEALENEQRIDEMSRQLDDAKLFRINTKQSEQEYDNQRVFHEKRIDELEQQQLQESNIYSQQREELQHRMSELQQELDVYKERMGEQQEAVENSASQFESLQRQFDDTTNDCNTHSSTLQHTLDIEVETSKIVKETMQYQLESLQRQIDDTTNDCNTLSSTLQHTLDIEIETSNIIKETLQGEREQRRRLEQVFDEKSIGFKDRLISFEQLLDDEIEQTKTLKQALQSERDQRQHQQQQQARVATPAQLSIYRQHNLQLQQIIEQYHNRHVVDHEQIIYLKNELYSLRHDIHIQNEMHRYRGIREACHEFIVHPIISWVNDPLWIHIVNPHVVVPSKRIWAQYYDVILSSTMYYLPTWRDYMVRASDTIQTWYRLTISVTCTLYQKYVLAVQQRIFGLIESYYPFVLDTWSRTQTHMRHQVDFIEAETSPFIVPAWKCAQSHWETTYVVIELWRNQAELLIVNIMINHGFDGTKYMRQFTSIFHSIPFHSIAGMTFLYYLIRRRRRRYVRPQL